MKVDKLNPAEAGPNSVDDVACGSDLNHVSTSFLVCLGNAVAFLNPARELAGLTFDKFFLRYGVSQSDAQYDAVSTNAFSVL